jgi:hypothetical protein
MNSTTIERYFPAFTLPARRLLLVIDAALRAVIGAARRVRSRFVFRFSLRVMMVLVLVVGGGLEWVVRGARIQREAVAGVRRAGGTAWYDWQWKAGQPDRDSFNVMPTPEQPRRHMMQFELKYRLDQYNAPQTCPVDDDSLVYLNKMNLLQGLWLDGRMVTDKGLAPLRLTPISFLYLRNTQLSDAGLARLAQPHPSFQNLRSVGILNTKVTDAGTEALQKARP